MWEHLGSQKCRPKSDSTGDDCADCETTRTLRIPTGPFSPQVWHPLRLSDLLRPPFLLGQRAWPRCGNDPLEADQARTVWAGIRPVWAVSRRRIPALDCHESQADSELRNCPPSTDRAWEEVAWISLARRNALSGLDELRPATGGPRWNR